MTQNSTDPALFEAMREFEILLQDGHRDETIESFSRSASEADVFHVELPSGQWVIVTIELA